MNLPDEKLSMCCVTCTAPVNIATIKYWGKKDTDLILPLNGSISATLSQDQLQAKTSVAVSRDFRQDRMWLNGLEEPIDNPRLKRVLNEVRRRARKRKCDETNLNENFTKDMVNWHVRIVSENNFPTAAGLASSAAGYACLVYALAKLFSLEGDTSSIARVGSGSACRSMFGGWVEWVASDDELQCVAHQVAAPDHWPDMRVLILVASDQRKISSSTAGMQNSVNTSSLLHHRASHVVPQRIKDMKKAIIEKDFEQFAELTMKDSNQLHAVCMDTYPPIYYMTDTSKAVVRLVHEFNKLAGEVQAAYTFDAGPNACIFLLKEHVPSLLAHIKQIFPPKSKDGFLRGIPVDVGQLDEDNLSVPHIPNGLKYIMHTTIGEGPQVLHDEAQSLIDNNGLPK